MNPITEVNLNRIDSNLNRVDEVRYLRYPDTAAQATAEPATQPNIARPPMNSAATRLIAVLGAPAAGKSTLTRQVSAVTGATVFRLREFAQDYRRTHLAAAGAFATDDPLGWLSDDTVAMLLDAAFRVPPHGLGPTVLLENLPGNAAQLGMLLDRAAAIGGRLELVVLAAPDSVLAARARTRRVCPGCERDPRGDPHRPAQSVPHDPDRCRACDRRLAPRRSDEPALFQARLRRFRDRMPAIRAAAARRQVPCHPIDSTSDAAAAVTALVNLRRLAPTPTPLRSAHP